MTEIVGKCEWCGRPVFSNGGTVCECCDKCGESLSSHYLHNGQCPPLQPFIRPEIIGTTVNGLIPPFAAEFHRRQKLGDTMTWEGNPSYEEVEMEYKADRLSLQSFIVKNDQFLEEFRKEWECEHPLIITRPECEAQYKSWSTWYSRYVDFVKHRSKNNAS